MKQLRLSRRQLFKASAFGVGALSLPALGLTSVAAAPSQAAQAAADAPRLTLPQPTFNPIASTTAFGPPTDIAAGWDGTLWAIDASGAPHLYDPVQQQWHLHGEGIDAACLVGTTYYWFKGAEFVSGSDGSNIGPVKTIAAQWPGLPDSFKLGLRGAANVNGALVFFKGGWYLPADAPQSRAKLTDLANWPQAPAWVDGVIDAVHSDGSATVLLFRGGQFVTANLQTKAVTTQPAPISSYAPWQNQLPAAWAASGIDAALQTSGGVFVYNGAAVAAWSGLGTTTILRYIGASAATWPAAWHPVLNQAPSGRVGNLWTVDTSQNIFQHDGAQWIQRFGKVQQVAVGQDDAVYHISAEDPRTLWKWDGIAGWTDPATAAVPLAQVAVGSASHVSVRDNTNQVHRYSNQTFTPVNLGAGVPNPTHMAANADGTLWHCNSANPNAFRFISESTSASVSLPLKQGITANVHKVASTGFGAAHCLTTHSDGSTQVYRYDSPYVFKTSNPYQLWGSTAMAQGLGRLYFVHIVNFQEQSNRLYLTVRFVAVDAHTGAEVASYTPPGDSTQYTGLAFDPVNDLVYVGTSPLGDNPDNDDNTTPGQIIALDARTLAVKWIYQTKAGVDGTPALNGTGLCFGDRTNTLYMFDTRAALATPAAPKPQWTWVVPTQPASTHRVTTPVIANDTVYAAAWDLDTVAIGGNEIGHYHYLAQCDAATGLNGSVSIGDFIPADINKPLVFQNILTAPALGTLRATDGSDVNVAFVNDGFSVYAHSFDKNKTPATPSFALPTGRISTGFAYDDGTLAGTGLSSTGLSISNVRLWFGDNVGNLWSLNSALQPVDNTPHSLGAQSSIFTTPVLYKDPQGGVTVLSGLSPASGGTSPQPPSLYGYDPKAGQHAAVPTGVTYIWNLSQGTTNGVVYVSGGGNSTPDGQVSQVFGIRVDELPQALRDFIIESQMMQDPDPSAPGGDATDPSAGSGQAPVNPIPPSRARYQTHLTVVDDGKHPIPQEPVKIWADQPMTIQVDGAAYDVGPGDSQYAALKTGTDGALVITSGYSKADGSDTPDMYVPALRVWASFMDPYERVVVNPDHEFHQRTSTAHSDASDNDPDKVNLATCKSYAGRGGSKPAALFTPDEQSAGQSKNCADAIGQMKSGVGFGGGGASTSAATLFNRLMLHTGGRRQAQRTLRSSGFATSAASAPPPKYVAYSDLTGSGYFPTNIPATRPTTVNQPTGLLFTKPQGQPTTKATFSVVHHADAAAAIDTLPPPTPNPPWAQAPLPLGERLGEGASAIQRTDNIFTDFWNWLKGVAAEITHIIVSVADEVTVGIRLLVNGVEQIFKAVVKVIDDIASAIGSFFKMIEKFIEDVVAALSTLFNFGEIMWTHRWMANQVNAQTQALKDAITSQIVPAMDSFFKQGEDAIKKAFDGLRKQIMPGNQLNDLKGSGSTTHTALSVQTSSGGTSNQAVQGNWGMQKMKTGLPSASSPTFTQAALTKTIHSPNGTTDDDPISAFAQAFINRLTGDGDLNAVFTQLQSDLSHLFQVNSAADFFTTLLDTLLDILEALLIGALAVSNALVDGILAIAATLIEFIVTTINAPLDIPVLSWLYRQLFNEQLTWLNMATLVAAIPVTAIYRAAVGRYPSQDLSPAPSQAVEKRSKQATANSGAIVLGCINGVLALAIGITRALNDTGSLGSDPNVMRLGFTFLYNLFSGPYTNPNPTAYAWVNYGGSITSMLVLGVNVKMTLDTNLPNPPGYATRFREIETFLSSIIAIMRLLAVIVGFLAQGNFAVTADLGFANSVASVVPPILGPLTRAGVVGRAIVIVVDVVSGLGMCALLIAIGFLNQQPAPTRLYFPWISRRTTHSNASR
jgi:hypothetical protein